MILTISNLTKKINKELTIKQFNLKIEDKKIIGLFGPNGSGKSSIFNIISGIESCDSGTISIIDRDRTTDLTSLPLHERAKNGLGYLPQESTLFNDLSVYHNLLAVREIAFSDEPKKSQKREVEAIMAKFQIEKISDRLCRFLSGGEKRRVELARLLLLEPKFILLDEPFAGIDPISIRQIKKLILEIRTQASILITDHQVMATLDICDHGIIIHKGITIAAGSPAQIINHKLAKSLYLGEQAE